MTIADLPPLPGDRVPITDKQTATEWYRYFFRLRDYLNKMLGGNLAEWAEVDPSEDGKSLVSAADYAAMVALLGVTAETQGDWTPVLLFGGLDTDITYAYQFGRWARSGNTVDAWAYVALTSKGSATGDAVFDGLPFLPATNDMQLYAGTVGYMGKVTSIVSAGILALQGFPFVFPTNLPGVAALTTLFWNDTNFTDDTEIVFHIRYEAEP